MLKIDTDHGFDATVRINLKGLQASFGIRCRLIDIDRLSELQNAQEARTISPPEFVKEWLLGWNEDEVREGDGPLPFTPENLERMLNVPGAAVAMTEAFYSGYEEAEEKNSGPLPATS